MFDHISQHDDIKCADLLGAYIVDIFSQQLHFIARAVLGNKHLRIFYLAFIDINPHHIASALDEGHEVTTFSTADLQYAARRGYRHYLLDIWNYKLCCCICLLQEVLFPVSVSFLHNNGKQTEQAISVV